MVTSDSLTPNTLTLIHTWPGVPTGTGASLISSASRPPGRVTTTARIAGTAPPAACRDAAGGPAGEPGQAPVQAVGGGGPEQPEGGVGASAVAVDGDVVGIAAEVGDVPLGPGERGDGVLEEEVAGFSQDAAVLGELERTLAEALRGLDHDAATASRGQDQ